MMIQIFLLLDFSGESVSVVSPFFAFSVIFSFPLILFSSMIYLTISMTKILLGIPLFSLFSLVYALVLSWRINDKKHQNWIQHERIQGEHPAGAHCLISNGKTTATAQTKPVRQLSAGLGTGQYGRYLNQG